MNNSEENEAEAEAEGSSSKTNKTNNSDEVKAATTTTTTATATKPNLDQCKFTELMGPNGRFWDKKSSSNTASSEYKEPQKKSKIKMKKQITRNYGNYIKTASKLNARPLSKYDPK